MTLKEIVEDDIYGLVGHTLAGRGYDYYASGMVLSLRARGGTITAEVAGSSAPSYTVKIWCDEDGVDGTCTCPYSAGIDVCKHVAAALFEWVYERSDEAPEPAISEVELRRGLENLSKADLVSLLLEAAEESDTVYQKLRIRLERAEATGEKSWIREMKAEIQQLCATDAYGGWEYIDIGTQLDSLLQPLENAEITDGLEIYTYTLEQIQQIDADDEMDNLVAVRDQIYAAIGNLLGDSNYPHDQKRKYFDMLMEIYFDAQRWSDSELGDVIANACCSPEDFDFVLGKVEDRDEWGRAKLLAKLYLQSGQEEAYLEIRRQNLNSDMDYLELADFYQTRGRAREAIEVAEEGLQRLTHKAALYPFLEEQYEAQGAVSHLQRILMAQFTEFPASELYQRLKRVAEAAGTWNTDLKRRLLAPLEERRIYGAELLLADIHIADGDYDKAVALSQGDIGEAALSRIAEGVAETYPEKAIAIYKRIVDDYLAVNGRDRYRAAAQFAAKIKGAYLDILRDEAAWNNYIRGIRFENRRRPALIDEFRNL
ncbi:MAG: hypothetical protein O7E52_04710 [Candidatus Poribacteria bacterium]|nr:hypothetical protein [Candidatus Poribacteria bacterium]